MQVRYQAALRPDRGAATIAAERVRAQPGRAAAAARPDLSPRSATSRASSRRSLPARGARGLALEPREQRAHLLFHLGHEQLPLRLVEAQLDLGLVLLALVQQRAPRPGDREPAVVEQLLDADQEPHLVRPVHAVARAVLLRAQHAELRLPVAQHVRLDAEHVAHLADRAIELAVRILRRLLDRQWNVPRWPGPTRTFPGAPPCFQAS